MPLPEHPTFLAMMEAAKRAFDAHQINGKVQISYATRAYYGKMT
jgi:hypothetical protein